MLNSTNIFEQVAREEGVTITELERILGMSGGVLSRAIRNKTDIQAKWIFVLLEKYPLYRIDNTDIWKEGAEMVDNLHLKGKLAEPEPEYKKSASKKGIPEIPLEAVAGWGQGDVTVMAYETKKYIVPEFDDLHVDFMIRVKGTSMYPHYNSGDLVACIKVAASDFFQWNKVYVLDTTQGAMIKRIKPSLKADHLQCLSDNPKFDPFDIPIGNIHAYALVVGVIRLE